MKPVRYFVETTLYLFFVPALLSNMTSFFAIMLIAGFVNSSSGATPDAMIVLFILGGAVLAALLVLPSFANSWFRKRFQDENLPRNFFVRYFPIWFPLIFWLALAFFMHLEHIGGSAILRTRLGLWLAPPQFLYLIWILFTVFAGLPHFLLVYALPLILSGGIALICTIYVVRSAVTSSTGKKIGIPLLLILLILPGLLFHIQSQRFYGTVLRLDQKTTRMNDENPDEQDQLDLSVYTPFSENNKLVLIEEPTLEISENHPKIGGAFAFYPIYAAAAQAIYKNIDDEMHRYIHVGTSPEALKHLLYGNLTMMGDESQRYNERRKADMIFMLEPSQEQYAVAKSSDTQIHLTKVAREGFVFFVNADNPLEDLSSEQIRDIYSRKIMNWRDLGGHNEKILPFQRPEGSGSQTAMIRMMQDRKLPPPLREEQQVGMGGIIRAVADYRNYPNAIGYSFRFFTESMFHDDGIKILAVDGVKPTVETIRNGTYPFIYDFYIITNGPPTGNTQRLIDWFLSPQGQELIERTGYVPVTEKGRDD